MRLKKRVEHFDKNKPDTQRAVWRKRGRSSSDTWVSNSYFRSRPNRSESPACRQAAGTLCASFSAKISVEEEHIIWKFLWLQYLESLVHFDSFVVLLAENKQVYWEILQLF